MPKGLTFLNGDTFNGCSSLKTITLPDTLQHIGALAFYDCANLCSITIPKNVKNIEYCSFARCPNLKEVTIPADLNDIGWRAFGYMTYDYEYPYIESPYDYVYEDFSMLVYQGTAGAYYAQGYNIPYHYLDLRSVRWHLNHFRKRSYGRL